jgi:hypothetical protein
MQRDRAKIGWAFDALMAGAARPDSAANGQTNGQTDEKTRHRGSGAGRGKQRDTED